MECPCVASSVPRWLGILETDVHTYTWLTRVSQSLIAHNVILASIDLSSAPLLVIVL